MIRKTSSADAASSVVELGGVRHLFAAAVPRNGGDFQRQAHDALRTIEAVAREEGVWGSIVQQAVFLERLPAGRGVPADRARFLWRPTAGHKLHSPGRLAEANCWQSRFWESTRRRGSAEVRRLSERTVTARHNGITWVHCANIIPETPAETVYDRSLDAFRRLERELAACGFRFDQVVRTWLYLGDIVGLEGEVPRYQKSEPRPQPTSSRTAGLPATARRSDPAASVTRPAPASAPMAAT